MSLKLCVYPTRRLFLVKSLFNKLLIVEFYKKGLTKTVFDSDFKGQEHLRRKELVGGSGTIFILFVTQRCAHGVHLVALKKAIHFLEFSCFFYWNINWNRNRNRIR